MNWIDSIDEDRDPFREEEGDNCLCRGARACIDTAYREIDEELIKKLDAIDSVDVSECKTWLNVWTLLK